MDNKKLLRFALPLLVLALALGGCRRHKHAQPDLSATQEPDKVLFERSLEDIKNKKYDVARLTLQTLINAYPDSDYLADAKLAIADSYYEQGGATGLTHAEVEYKDYITFFPNSPKTAYAQYRAAMCHYRQLEKPDRDRSHARRAEEEFQQLVLNYGDSEYAREGEQRLVQVQELLADSEFRVGRFYFLRGNARAAAGRFTQLVERYPNYSQRDEALWMLAQAWENSTVPLLWKADSQKAAEYYARIIREHPASAFAENARAELARLGVPAPEPDPVLLARAQSVQPITLSEEERKGLLTRMFSLVSSRPDLSAAAPRLGPPPLDPPQQIPELPQPPIRSLGLQGSPAQETPPPASGSTASVGVQTLDEMPAGTVVGTPPADGKGKEGESQAKPGEQQPQQQPQQKPKKKKSFWRKIIPFI